MFWFNSKLLSLQTLIRAWLSTQQGDLWLSLSLKSVTFIISAIAEALSNLTRYRFLRLEAVCVAKEQTEKQIQVRNAALCTLYTQSSWEQETRSRAFWITQLFFFKSLVFIIDTIIAYNCVLRTYGEWNAMLDDLLA